MSEKIFLGGGGDEKASELLDDLFAEEFNKRNLKSLIYIPVALTSRPYSECLKWFTSIFGSRVPKIEMWESLDKKVLDGKEGEVAVYIGGGNTDRLMDLVVASGFDKQIISFVTKGGLIYGGSAGAIILGKDIRTAPESKGVSSFGGLDLIDGFSIACHFNKKSSAELKESNIFKDSKIMAIEENAGVSIDGKELSPVGPGHIYIFSKGVKKHDSRSFYIK